MYHFPKLHTTSNRSGHVVVQVALMVSLGACGGGGGGSSLSPGPATYNLAAGVSGLVTKGMNANLAISGTLMVKGVATAVTGTGTLALAPAVKAMFNGASAVSQDETVSGTVSGGGQTAPYSANVVDYYDPSTYAFLGETSAQEYDVAQAPITYPTAVMAGSSGALGTVSRYTDNTLGVSLGTSQLSYTIKAPVNASAPATVEITNKIYDTKQALLETDVTDYSLTSTNTMLLVSASAQVNSETLTFTVQ